MAVSVKSFCTSFTFQIIVFPFYHLILFKVVHCIHIIDKKNYFWAAHYTVPHLKWNKITKNTLVIHTFTHTFQYFILFIFGFSCCHLFRLFSGTYGFRSIVTPLRYCWLALVHSNWFLLIAYIVDLDISKISHTSWGVLYRNVSYAPSSVEWIQRKNLWCEKICGIHPWKEIHLKFNPPYSPEFNPIELAFNKVKAIIANAITKICSMISTNHLKLLLMSTKWHNI